MPSRAPTSKPERRAGSRSTRFALLAACVAIAASFGAVAGSLGVAKFGRCSPLRAGAGRGRAGAKDNVADEVKALKDTVAQLRATTKTLSDNFAALKTTAVEHAHAQNSKLTETLDRVEKSQAEQRRRGRDAGAPAPEVTGRSRRAAAVPMCRQSAHDLQAARSCRAGCCAGSMTAPR